MKWVLMRTLSFDKPIFAIPILHTKLRVTKQGLGAQCVPFATGAKTNIKSSRGQFGDIPDLHHEWKPTKNGVFVVLQS